MITRIGGLDALIDTSFNLPKIPGGKKVIYTTMNMPLPAIKGFKKNGQDNPFFTDIYELIKNRWFMVGRLRIMYLQMRVKYKVKKPAFNADQELNT